MAKQKSSMRTRSLILLVLLVTLSGCIVSFSSESVPIHTFYSQGPSPINNHDDAMHTRRCPLGMRVADPLVHHRGPSLKQEFVMEFTLPVFSEQNHQEQRRGIHGGLCERHYSLHDGRRQGRTRPWAGNRYDDEGGSTPHEIPRTRSVLDAQAEQYTLSPPGKVSSD